MKTLKKRPNYTPSIKTSCYSAFSFYPFFRNDRIPALMSAYTNQPSELHDRSFFILLYRQPTVKMKVLAFRSALPSDLYIGESRPLYLLTKAELIARD